MRRILLRILIIIPAIFGMTCKDENDNCHRTITFINNTEKSIYVQWDNEYPDTLSFGTGPSPALNPLTFKVLAKTSSDKPLWNRDCWEINFKDVIISDTLMIYVFDSNILENTDWSDVVHNYLVLRRYDLSLADLKDMGWKITYP